MLSLDPLLTERLEIRPFEMADKESAYAFSSDPVARQYIGGGALSREESDAGLERQLESVQETGLGARAVVEQSSERVVGYCGLQLFAETTDIELFYGYVRATWRRGIASEAAQALISLGFRSLPIECIVAIVHPENTASLRVLEKLDFRQVGTFPHPRWNVEHLLWHRVRG